MTDDWFDPYYERLIAAAAAAGGDAGEAALHEVNEFMRRVEETRMHELRGVSVAPGYRRPLAEQLLGEAKRRDMIGDVDKLMHGGYVPEVLVWVAAAAASALREIVSASE